MVPPFFLPLYGAEFGLSTLSSAALVSGFNLASALGRVLFGQLADYLGPVNALIMAMSSNGIALLVLWPVSMSLAPLIVFVIVSGISAGEPLQQRTLLTNRRILLPYAHRRRFAHRSRNHGLRVWSARDGLGSWLSARPTYRLISTAGCRRGVSWNLILSPRHVLRGQSHCCELPHDNRNENQDRQESAEKDVDDEIPGVVSGICMSQ